jgi:hypothetical protein
MNRSPNNNQPTNNPQGDTMNEDSKPRPQILRWTKPDGTSEIGTMDEIGLGYYRANKVEKGHKIGPAFTAPAAAPDVSDLLEEDTEDEPTEEVKVSAPVATAPRIEVVQREPVTVTPRTAEDTEKAHKMARDYMRKIGGDASEETWFPPGTEMMQIGKDTYRAKAQLHENMLPVAEAFGHGIERVRSEGRGISDPVDLTECKLTEANNGKGYALVRPGMAPLDLEYQGLDQLFGKVSQGMPGPLARMLHTLPAGEFIDITNKQLARAGRFVGGPTVVRIQDRDHKGRRSAFSVVGEGFCPLPLDRVLEKALTEIEAVAAKAGIDPRGEVKYNPRSTLATFKATWHAPEEYAARVGDPIEIGLKGKAGGAGNSFLTIQQALTLVRCINCTLMTWALTEKLRHSGSKTRTAEQNIRHGLSRASSAVEKVVSGMEEGVRMFGGLWGILKDTPIQSVALAGAKHTDVREALEAMVEKGQIGKDIARDALVQSLTDGFDREPGGSLADLVNAVTRAAHEGMLDDIQQWQLEREAGDLMMALAKKAQPEALKALSLPGVR